MEVPSCNAVYAKQSYWNERFSKESDYDWLTRYSEIKELIEPFVKKSSRILMMGCGNSTLSADMYDDGYHNITNIDFSNVVIENMKKKHVERSEMKWEVKDFLDLNYNKEFDVVIDKAAMDAVLVDEGSVWDPEVKALNDVHCVCTGISRSLTDTGVYLQITFSQPHFRRKYLEKQDYNWKVDIFPFGSGFGYFLMVCQKENNLITHYPIFEIKKEVHDQIKSSPSIMLPDTSILDINLNTSDLL